MKLKMILTVIAIALLVSSAGPALAQGDDEDLFSEDVFSEEPVAEAPVLEEEPVVDEGDFLEDDAAPEQMAADAEGADSAAAEQEAATVTISSELEEVQRMQRRMDTGDPGANMIQRMNAGGQVPLAVIGEGAAEAPQVYIVKPGDTLWDISARFLNDPFGWTRIHHDNPQIINPDLIYPGEPITVYPRDYEEAAVRVVQLLPPPEFAVGVEPEASEEVMQAQMETEVEFETIEEVEPSETDLAQRDRYLEELTKREELDIFDEAATELISRKRAVLARRQKNVIEYQRAPAAGWIEFLETSELNKAGYILGQEDETGRVRGAPGDLVYINRGQINGVAVGERYQIFRISKEVLHPVTGDYIGHKIIVVGFLQVETVQERTASARITESYEDVSVGNERLAGVEAYDRITPELDVPTDYRLRPNDQNIHGWVIANREGKHGLADHDILYIDRGSEHGVEVGNVFSVYRANRKVFDPEVGDRVQLPRFYVGEILVIRTDATASTALILRVRREVLVGDEVSVAPLTLEEEEAQAPSSASLMK